MTMKLDMSKTPQESTIAIIKKYKLISKRGLHWKIIKK